MATDRERAEHLLKGAFEPMLVHSPALGIIRDLMAKNQNGPDHGPAGGDGSINEAEWDALRRAVEGLDAAREGLIAFQAEIAKRPKEAPAPPHPDKRVQAGGPKPSG